MTSETVVESPIMPSKEECERHKEAEVAEEKKGSGWILMVIAVIVLAACATGVWYLYTRGGPTPSEIPLQEMLDEGQQELIRDMLDERPSESTRPPLGKLPWER